MRDARNHKKHQLCYDNIAIWARIRMITPLLEIRKNKDYPLHKENLLFIWTWKPAACNVFNEELFIN